MTKIAYSNYFKCFIKCALYYSDENWFFCLCDERGMAKKGSMARAKSSYKSFDWKEIEK